MRWTWVLRLGGVQAAFFGHWVAFGAAGGGSFGSSGAGVAGFSGLCYGGQGWAKPGEVAADPAGGERAWAGGAFPGRFVVGGWRAGGDELGVGGGDVRGPPVGLLGVAQRGGG